MRKAATDENARYLYHAKPEAGAYSSQPFFGLAMAKPWDRQYSSPNFMTSAQWTAWQGEDQINWNTHCAALETNGLNLDYVWFAPWECQLTHNKSRHEFWYTTGGARKDPNGEALASADEWTGYGYYDQGRAARMDEVVKAHEDHDVYVVLSVWPHQSLQAQTHSWGETGWDHKDRDEEENGFSSLDANIGNFFGSAGDTSGTGWLWQKNFYRYVVARWGYSRAIGLWVLIDELEGVGTSPTYWWSSHSTTYKWHDEVLKALRQLDWMGRPSTTSTTGWNYDDDPYAETERPDRGDWTGSTEQTDLLSHHAYHKVYFWRNGAMRNGQTNDYGWGATPELTTPYLNWNDIGDPLESYQAPIWHHLCGRMYQWVQNTAAKSRPWIVTEYGLFERQLPTQVDHPEFQRRLARSYLHFAAWSAFSAGHAGTPLKWCDGLNYGEMFPRGAGPFSAAKYPDLRDEITPLRSLLLQIDLASLTTRTSCLVTAPGGGASPIRCWGIKSTSKAVLWLFDDDFDKTQGATWGQSTRTYTSAEAASKQDHTVHITGLAGNRTYTIEWYNTWDGGVYRTETAAASAAGNLDLLVHTMSTTTRTPQEAWDGADVLLLIQ